MRDWLIVITVLLIAGILLDGFRRMRLARRERLHVSKSAELADKDVVQVGHSEFPSGGARVAAYRDKVHASTVNESLKQTYLSKKTTVGAPNRIPEQVTLNLDEHVPMLMDSVEDLNKTSAESVIDAEDAYEPSLGSLHDLDAIESEELTKAGVGHDDVNVESKEQLAPASTKRVASSSSKKVAEEPVYNQPDEVLIINVMAKSGTRFPGEELLSALMEASMKLGAMDIFHRHINDDGDGPVLFSLANMVVPGTFNLAQMREFETPGVSLFLSLPLNIEDEDGEIPDGLCIRAFDNMAATAKALVSALDGELKDENRSAMTQQTIEHARQRVVEFERKQKLSTH